ncbi:MAG: hypothetical protein ACLRZ7_07655 [Lachnospiraceae bacterium]
MELIILGAVLFTAVVLLVCFSLMNAATEADRLNDLFYDKYDQKSENL